MFKIGLVGTWHVHFSGYAKEVAKHEGCVITRLWDPDEAKSREEAEKFGCEFFDDYDAFLSGGEVEGIVVASSTDLHPELLIKAANAGKHIFTEKVLAFTLEDTLAIKEAIVKSGKQFCISFPWRSRPDFLWLKQALDEKLLGDVTYCRMRNAHNGASAGWLPQTFFDPKTCGGGAMMDLGAHGMYLLNWLMGKPKTVISMFTNVMVQSVEDNAVSVFSYENGAIGVSETGFVAQENPFSLEVVGTKGTIFLGGHAGKAVFNVGNGWETPELPEAKPSPIVMWMDGVMGGTEIPYTIDDAVALTETMEAAYKAAHQNVTYTLT
ncbi:MAG: Gfo/Idh/MocA family oxidoreductase [Oscillospiraceae bacterium]|nr:Gfo/Idh/MocA family oxidoreductase [Oscillospiraceae bacterium]